MKNLIAILLAFTATAATARAETLIALTVTNQLLRFDSATPGTVTNTATISGLVAGDVLAGIDVRPSNNTLYAFATDAGLGASATGKGRVYSINPVTGVATASATLSADIADTTAPFPFMTVSGSSFGVDFNPVADRLRVTSDTGQNLRINVATGATQLDMPLAYIAGDANAGTPPAVVASAYTNSIAGALTTLLYDLDSSVSNLATQAPPNDGILNSKALTSGIVFADSTFDISGQTGVGYVVLDGLTLGTIDLIGGVVTEVGPIATQGSITGLAVLGVPEPTSAALVACALVCFSRRRRRG